MQLPHPQAKFVGWWRSRHPDARRWKIAVFELPVRPYMMLVEVNDSDSCETDYKKRGANDGDSSTDDHAGFDESH